MLHLFFHTYNWEKHTVFMGNRGFKEKHKRTMISTVKQDSTLDRANWCFFLLGTVAFSINMKNTAAAVASRTAQATIKQNSH